MPDKIHRETLDNGFTFLMNFIAGGVFNMGSTTEDSYAFDDEKPQRMGVQVAPFYLGAFTVTQALWKAVQGEHNNPSSFQGDQRPVETVSWYDAHEFIRALNDQTKVHRAELNLGEYRLPTEAEWEYAARDGAMGSDYPYAGSEKLKEVGWYDANSDQETHAVGLLMPNRLGLYDMSGNVWEWCADHWHNTYEGASNKYSGIWVSDDEGNSRVMRGGSCSSEAQLCRIACRNYNAPDGGFNRLGFRLALSASVG